MMRDFERSATFAEDKEAVDDDEPEIIDVTEDRQEQAMPEQITPEELERIQRKMEAEQQEFLSIKKALQDMGQTGTTKEAVNQDNDAPADVHAEVDQAEAELQRQIEDLQKQ